MKRLERTTVKNMDNVILTAGMTGSTGRVFGVFLNAADARAENADEMIFASVGADALTADQVAMAERNSARLAD